MSVCKRSTVILRSNDTSRPLRPQEIAFPALHPAGVWAVPTRLREELLRWVRRLAMGAFRRGAAMWRTVLRHRPRRRAPMRLLINPPRRRQPCLQTIQCLCLEEPLSRTPVSSSRRNNRLRHLTNNLKLRLRHLINILNNTSIRRHNRFPNKLPLLQHRRLPALRTCHLLPIKCRTTALPPEQPSSNRASCPLRGPRTDRRRLQGGLELQ
mmetsp:Transcript_40048/g.61556  ORF Transcript_40048/g.61556 Transcript_40048/m.61556 type:complete len:210 (+) Transcript_40048:1132-1761(+)